MLNPLTYTAIRQDLNSEQLNDADARIAQGLLLDLLGKLEGCGKPYDARSQLTFATQGIETMFTAIQTQGKSSKPWAVRLSKAWQAIQQRVVDMEAQPPQASNAAEQDDTNFSVAAALSRPGTRTEVLSRRIAHIFLQTEDRMRELCKISSPEKFNLINLTREQAGHVETCLKAEASAYREILAGLENNDSAYANSKEGNSIRMLAHHKTVYNGYIMKLLASRFGDDRYDRDQLFLDLDLASRLLAFSMNEAIFAHDDLSKFCCFEFPATTKLDAINDRPTQSQAEFLELLRDSALYIQNTEHEFFKVAMPLVVVQFGTKPKYVEAIEYRISVLNYFSEQYAESRSLDPCLQKYLEKYREYHRRYLAQLNIMLGGVKYQPVDQAFTQSVVTEQKKLPEYMQVYLKTVKPLLPMITVYVARKEPRSRTGLN